MNPPPPPILSSRRAPHPPPPPLVNFGNVHPHLMKGERGAHRGMFMFICVYVVLFFYYFYLSIYFFNFLKVGEGIRFFKGV